jgi:hypothetical protein
MARRRAQHRRRNDMSGDVVDVDVRLVDGRIARAITSCSVPAAAKEQRGTTR